MTHDLPLNLQNSALWSLHDLGTIALLPPGHCLKQKHPTRRIPASYRSVVKNWMVFLCKKNSMQTSFMCFETIYHISIYDPSNEACLNQRLEQLWCCIWIHGRQLLARAKTYRRSCRSPWIGPAWRFWAISFVLDMVPWADVSNVDTTNYRQVCFYLQSAPQMEDLNFSGQVQAALLAFLNARHGIKYVVHCFCDMHTDCCYTTYICILDILLIFADPHTDYGIPFELCGYCSIRAWSCTLPC